MASSTELVSSIAKQLSGAFASPEICLQHAWWILTFVTATQRAHLIAQKTVELTKHQEKKLAEIVHQIVAEHKPLQYIIGSVPFGDTHILVKPPVLIPRPETEEWVLWLINTLKDQKNTPLAILDLCTGSGCIAIALAKAYPQAKVLATDLAEHALACARQNTVHNGVKNVTLLKSDLFQHIPSEQQFDLIVANPPYIAPEEWAALDTSVTKWEDKQALVAQDHGLALIFAIIAQAYRYLRHNTSMQAQKIPQLVIEIGHQQGSRVKAVMERAGFVDVNVRTDSNGKDRVVTGRMA